MGWNYRIVRRRYPFAPDAGAEYGIHEAYYHDGETEPHSITQDAVEVCCDEEEGVDALRGVLERMLKALDKPIVRYEDIEAREHVVDPSRASGAGGGDE